MSEKKFKTSLEVTIRDKIAEIEENEADDDLSIYENGWLAALRWVLDQIDKKSAKVEI